MNRRDFPWGGGTRAFAALAVMLAVPSETVACPTADSTTYAANKPSLLDSITHSSPSCPSGLPYCAPSLVFVPGDSSGNPDPDSPHLLDPLLVFLPGSGMEPNKHDLILQTAAFAGYRTIGLSYYNQPSIADQCTILEDPAIAACATDYRDECAYMVRMERLNGIDNPATNQVVPVQDSIASRLLAVLGTLIAQDMADGVNDWGWDQYCVGEFHHGNPVGLPLLQRVVWSNVVVAGFSQGAGYPHLISLNTNTDGIVSLDGGNDRCDGGANAASYYDVLTNAMANPGGASPGDGEFAMIHEDTAHVGTVLPEIVPDSFEYVQLDTSVHEVDTVSLPLTQNVARTDQFRPAGCTGHMSVARDGCIPDKYTWNEADPADVDAAGSPDQMHLFAAFVEGFCNAE